MRSAATSRNVPTYLARLRLTHRPVDLWQRARQRACIYLTDLGLASSASFDLTPDELEFLDASKTHDVAYLATRLLNRVVTNLGGVAERELRDETIRCIAAGEPARSVLPDRGAVVVERFAPVASIINSFYERLHGEDRNAIYPADAVEIAWTSTAE